MPKSLYTLNAEIEAQLQDTTNVAFSEAQIRQGLNVGIAALGTMWYREERLMPIVGTGSHPLRLPADCRVNDGLRVVILTTDVGRSVVKKFTSPATYTSYMSETEDGIITTLMDISALATTGYIYLGAHRRFASATVRMAYDPMAVNVNAATLSAEYYGTGGWTTLSLTDDTKWNDRTFGKDGIISWSIPDTWIPTTIDSLQAYYIRLAVSATLSAAVKIAEVRFDTASIHKEAYLEDWKQEGVYLTIRMSNLVENNLYYLKLIYEAPFTELPTYAAINDAGNLSATATTVTVDAGTGGADATLWPEMGYLQIDSEIMRYHKVSATSLQIERGVFGTRAATHANDAVIYPVFPGDNGQCELVKTMAFAWLLGDLQLQVNVGSDYLKQYLATSKQFEDRFMQKMTSGLYRQRSLPLIRRG